jgi:tellurite resistance protein TehA-like permease
LSVSSERTSESTSAKRTDHAASRPAGELIAPGSGAVVMGTGIVSIALATDGATALSRVLLVLDALSWLTLAAVAATLVVRNRPRFLREARSPAGLTGVAGTAVLGSRLVELGWSGPAMALLVLGLLAWAVLMVMLVPHLPRRGSGQIFLLTVAAESLASVGANVATAQRIVWLVYVALVLAGVGLFLYPFALIRFRPSELIRGRGDQWVAGGSLAISSLALADLALAAKHLGAPSGTAPVLDDLALAVWVASALWIVPLLVGELARPRLGYRSQRWSTVFPLGMYSASAFGVATVAGASGLDVFARVWIWLALAAWAATSAGMLRRALDPFPRRG